MREFPVEHVQEFSLIRLHGPRPLPRHDTEFAIHMPRRGSLARENRCNNGCFLVRSDGPLIDTRPYTTRFVRPGGP